MLSYRPTTFIISNTSVANTYSIDVVREAMSNGSITSSSDRAKELAESGNTKQAIDEFREIVSQNPEDYTSWYYLGTLYSKSGMFPESIESFRKSDEHFPNYAPTAANLAILLKDISPKEAVKYARIALITYPDNQELQKISKFEAFEELPSLEAIAVGESKTNQGISNIESGEVGLTKAREMTEKGDHSGAVNIWRGLIKEAPKSPEIWRGLAEALHSAGFPEKAKQCMKQASRLEIAVEDHLAQIGEIDDINDADYTDEVFIEAANNIPPEATKQKEFRGDLNEAIEWYNMGTNLLNEGNFSEAITCFEKAIGGSPRDEVDLRARSHSGRGNALFNMSRFQESVIAYHTAITMDPSSASARTLYNMGTSYAAVELFVDAAKCFTQSLEIGLDKEEVELCEKQISRCRLLAREQEKRQAIR